VSTASEPLIYRLDQIEVDPSRGCVRRAGREVHIKPKSFHILVYFLTQRDRLVTKEELMAQFWKDTVVTDDALTQCIGEVRRALGDNSRDPVYLKTVPKRGYRFLGDVHEVRGVALVATERVTSIQIEEEYTDAEGRPAAGNRIWLAAALAVAVVAGWFTFQATRARVLVRPADSIREVAWWRFNEGSGVEVKDSSGGRDAGSISGGVTRVPGKMGMAIALDGVSGFISGTDRAGVLPSGDSPRSITAWFRARSTNGDSTTLFSYGDAVAPRGGFHMMLRADGRVMAGNTLDRDPVVVSRNRFDDGKWHQATATYEGPASGDMARLFVDGLEESSEKLPYRPATGAGSPWMIGRSLHLGGGTPFRGEIDDVRVYNAAVSAYQASALFRCSAGLEDIAFGGASYYFLPLYGNGRAVHFIRNEEGRVEEVRNAGRDFAGIQFARRQDECSMESLRGADSGQNLRIVADLLVPTDAAGHETEAGPYFRSRRAAPGDGLLGGTSAGYWVMLHSTGQVTIRRLNPQAVVAFTSVPKFDAAIFHRVEMTAVGEQLRVKVDGRLLEFDQGGHRTTTVAIPPVWDGPPAAGHNGGGAGINFSAMTNRSAIGGQRARAVQVEVASASWE
jgi:DNA-binding winged helix-turn-helix (wHTH) protein